MDSPGGVTAGFGVVLCVDGGLLVACVGPAVLVVAGEGEDVAVA